MIVAMLGDFSSGLDEGFKNTSHYLANALEARHQVMRLNVKRIFTQEFWRIFWSASPQIIHTNAQPSSQSLLFMGLTRYLRPGVPNVLLTLRAEAYFQNYQVTRQQRRIIRLARPDLVLVQSETTGKLFQQMNCTTAYLSNGVDLERFSPVSMPDKRKLRSQYGLDPDRLTVLSVGLLVPERNLMSLSHLIKAGMQVLVAGSLYKGANHNLTTALRGAGLTVLEGYQAHIDELYRLADVYVFPPVPGNSLTMPLSVLEAMACNLPVITTRFNGLVHAFGEGNGLRFVEANVPLGTIVKQVLNTPCTTRELVTPYSWQAIAGQLEDYYQNLRGCSR